MTLPKRIRLLKSVKDHLYNEVKVKLATDKEVKDLKNLASRIKRYHESN